MRIGPLLFLTCVAAPSVSACALLRQPDAIAPEAPRAQAEEPSGEAHAKGRASGVNSAEVPGDSSSVEPGRAPASPQPALSRPEVQAMITGAALTGAGVAGALIGGVLLGSGGGFCHGDKDSCPAGVALPVVGALWIGASVLPLVLGVSLWVPRTKEPPGAPSSQARRPTATARPAIVIGPGSAGVRLEF